MSSDGSSKNPLEEFVKARLLGERIDIKSISSVFTPIATSPFIAKTEKDNLIVIFRFGAVVFFGSNEDEFEEISKKIIPFVKNHYKENDTDEANVVKFDNDFDNVNHSGEIFFKEKTIERYQLCAEVLAKSVVLNRYENKTATVFENVEPLAESLKNKGRSGTSLKKLHCQTGEIMLSMTQTVGRAEISEKPDILWENPDLERLYVKLMEEYEIRDRSFYLQKRLNVASDAVSSFVSLSQHSQMCLLVWYVIILIAIAIGVDLI